MDNLCDLPDTEPLVFLRTRHDVGGLRYEIRLEPHLASRGRNLFLTLNVNQERAPDDDLRAIVLEPIEKIRAYMERLEVYVLALMQREV